MLNRWFSDYRRMVLATIGLWRFLGKFGTVIRRKFQRLQSEIRKPKIWSPTLFVDIPRPSALAGKWLFGSKSDLNSSIFTTSREQVMLRAKMASHRIFVVNGRTLDLNQPPHNGRWDVDPYSRKRWPETTVFAPLLEMPGDVRYPWELDRMHHLVWFGQAWRYTKDDYWPKEAVVHLEEMLSEAPYEHGIHWRDGLQLAVRIYSMIALADLCYDASTFFHRHINNAVVGHLGSLVRQLSPNSEITNNHVIGEASAIALAGLYLNRLGYLRRGLRRLRVELRRQLYSDGIPYEGTIPYIRFDLDFLTLLGLALRAMGQEVPSWLLDSIIRMSTSLAALADAKGRIPPIGDGDDGRVLRLDEEPYLTVNESLHVAGILTGEVVAPQPPREGFAWWAAGPSIGYKEKLDFSIDYLEESGLVHLHSGLLDIWLDCGPTGYGLKGPGGHGHNDTTAIVVHLDGVGLLHDPGWYTYYGNIKMRDELRCTRAHNSITIDDEEQAALGGLFEIMDQCQPTPVRIKQLNGSVCIICGHSGFGRLGKGISYNRYISFSGSGPWKLRVTDKVRSRSRLKINVHLGSDLKWTHSDAGWMLPGGHNWHACGGQMNLHFNDVPFSRCTGILESGSSLDWEVDPMIALQNNEFSYISRWEMIIQVP